MLRLFSTAAGFDLLTAGISREDFRRAGDRSSDAKADITLTQVIMTTSFAAAQSDSYARW